MTTPLVDALDRLARDGLLTPRQHRKLVRAAGYLEGPPIPASGFAGRLLAFLRRPPAIALLGLRFLRGDMSEAAFSARLKIDTLLIVVVGGVLIFSTLLVQALAAKENLLSAIWTEREPIVAIVAGLTLMAVAFIVLLDLPLSFWWRRRRRHLAELSAQRGPGGDV